MKRWISLRNWNIVSKGRCGTKLSWKGKQRPDHACGGSYARVQALI